jgi:hypothetical protein
MGFYETEYDLLEFIFGLQWNKFISESDHEFVDKWLRKRLFVIEFVFNQTFIDFKEMLGCEVVMPMWINAEIIQNLIINVN